MKKMQCEVCGGTEIKKVGDGIFECQSCGIQYSASEVRTLLKDVGDVVRESPKAAAQPPRFTNMGDVRGMEAAISSQKSAEFVRDPKLSAGVAVKIEGLLESGNKIAAIGEYRKATGADLATAKEAVEAIYQAMTQG